MMVFRLQQLLRDMIESIRGRMRNLQKRTKEIILKGTMIILLGFLVVFIFISTKIYNNQGTRQDEYVQYLGNYKLKYTEDQKRFRDFVFYQTRDQIVFNQRQYDQSYTEGLNKFSDLTEPEFQQLYLIVTSMAKSKGYEEIAEFQNDYFYDWEMFLPPVKNMRDFDGSHIFSAIASAQFQINKNQVIQYREMNRTLEIGTNWITLSEQQVIDCCKNCLDKRIPGRVFSFIIEHGISTDTSYPYISSIFNSNAGECKTEVKKRQFKIKVWHQISGCNLISQRLQFGPIVVSVDARNWRTYQGGIFSNCGNTRNHYALLIGRGIGFWKIRNSWGRLWGEHGHIRIKSGNTCGICSKASYGEFQQ